MPGRFMMRAEHRDGFAKEAGEGFGAHARIGHTALLCCRR